jgi:hypothetical protein
MTLPTTSPGSPPPNGIAATISPSLVVLDLDTGVRTITPLEPCAGAAVSSFMAHIRSRSRNGRHARHLHHHRGVN